MPNQDVTQTIITALQEQIDTLEVNQSFQNESINALEKTVATQFQEIQSLHKKMQLLSDYLKTLQTSQIKSAQEESPPPHY